MAKSPLGRGLSALLSGNTQAAPEDSNPRAITGSSSPRESGNPSSPPSGAVSLPMDQIKPCAFQPRRNFDEASLKELASSIKSQGIVQPLVVRTSAEGYELIAGERRWRAAQIAALTEVPVVIREADDREVIELALVENLQRENLNPIEEANGYQQLIDQFNLRQDEAARKVGKSRTAVANALRLLKLPSAIQTMLKEGQLSVGHAKVILGLSEDAQKTRIAKKVIKEGLSVRETEGLINPGTEPQKEGQSSSESGSSSRERDPHLQRVEEQIRRKLSTKVALKYHQGKGSIDIKFFTDEDLERIVHLLGIESD